jgi:hypothetical protein
VRESEVDLLECGFGAPCDDQLLSELRGDLKHGHDDGWLAYARVRLAQLSFDAGTAPADDGSCVEPWW